MRAKDRYGVMGSAHQKVHVCHESCAKLTYEVCSSLSYFYGAKIGVLGLNGSGKSSLLRILAGRDKEFNGETVLAPGYTVGLFTQEPELDESKTVREIVEEGVQEVVGALNEYNRINEKFAEPMSDDEMGKLIEQQGIILQKLDAMDAWELDSCLELFINLFASLSKIWQQKRGASTGVSSLYSGVITQQCCFFI